MKEYSVIVVSDASPRWFRIWSALAPLRGSLVVASVVICFDIVFCGFYAMSSLVCPVWFVVSIAKAIIQRPGARVAAIRIAIPVATLLFAITNYSVQKNVAMANAERIIRACESYRVVNGAYPDELSQLVPLYLSSIPRAKYCCSDDTFRYAHVAGRHALVWYLYPGFLRRSYVFETQTWHYVD
jgi:hypothetical protein